MANYKIKTRSKVDGRRQDFDRELECLEDAQIWFSKLAKNRPVILLGIERTEK